VKGTQGEGGRSGELLASTASSNAKTVKKTYGREEAKSFTKLKPKRG